MILSFSPEENLGFVLQQPQVARDMGMEWRVKATLFTGVDMDKIYPQPELHGVFIC